MLTTQEMIDLAPYLHVKMNSANMYMRIAAVKALGNYAKYKPLPVSLIDKNINLLFKYSEKNRADEGEISVAIAALAKYAHHNHLSSEEGKALAKKALKNMHSEGDVLMNTSLSTLAELVINNYAKIEDLNISQEYLENLFKEEYKEVHPGLNKLI